MAPDQSIAESIRASLDGKGHDGIDQPSKYDLLSIQNCCVINLGALQNDYRLVWQLVTSRPSARQLVYEL